MNTVQIGWTQDNTAGASHSATMDQPFFAIEKISELPLKSCAIQMIGCQSIAAWTYD